MILGVVTRSPGTAACSGSQYSQASKTCRYPCEDDVRGRNRAPATGKGISSLGPLGNCPWQHPNSALQKHPNAAPTEGPTRALSPSVFTLFTVSACSGRGEASPSSETKCAAVSLKPDAEAPCVPWHGKMDKWNGCSCIFHG